MRYANNLLKNPATKRLSGKSQAMIFCWSTDPSPSTFSSLFENQKPSAPVENGNKSVSQTEFLRRSILETPSRYPTQGPALFFTKPPIDVKASITETSLMRAACSAWKMEMPTFHRSSGAILEPKISMKMASKKQFTNH